MKTRRWLWLALYGLLFVLGGGLGVWAGVPGMVERVGARAVARVESRLGVTVHADEVDWSLGGRATIKGLRVDVHGAGPDEPPLLAAELVTIHADVALWDRRVRLERVDIADGQAIVTARAAGGSNLEAVVSAFRGDGGGGSAAGTRGLRWLEPVIPEVHGTNLSVTTPLPDDNPLGLALPPHVVLAGGTLSVTPADGGGHQVEARFAETSVDPGHGFDLTARAADLTALSSVEVGFDRPARFFLGDRVAGLRGVEWTPEGVALRELQLSVPVSDDGGGSVGAALTVASLGVSMDPATMRSLLQSRRLPTTQAAWLQLVSGVTVDKPVIVWAVGDDGHHSFEDLVGPLPGGPAPRLAARDGSAALALVTDAALRASEELTQDPARDKEAVPLRARVRDSVTGLTDRINRTIARVREGLDRLSVLPVVVTDGELRLSLREVPMVLSGVHLAVEVPTTPPADGEAVVAIKARATPDWSGDPMTLELRRDARSSLRLTSGSTPVAPLVALVGSASIAPKGRLSEGALSLSWTAGAERDWELSIDVAAEGMELAHPALAEAPLADLSGTLALTLRHDDEGETLATTRLEGALRGVKATGALKISAYTRSPRVHLKLDLPRTPVTDIVNAFPTALIPRLAGLEVTGTLAWPLEVTLDTADVDGMTIDSRPKLSGFSVVSMGQTLDFEALRSAVTYRIRREDGEPGRRTTGPMSARFTPIEEISPYLVKAVTTTEDGSYYRHVGVAPFAIEESILTNLKEWRFARGASTITQQLVKNLYLNPAKTVSRKLQELFIAWQLEKVLTKDEIMALYLNAIEFGPGLYGVERAAWEFFAKRPAELTLIESIYLSSIIPNPRKYYVYFEEGAVSAGRRKYLEVLLGVMVERGKITEEEKAAAAPYAPIFRRPGMEVPPPVDLDLKTGLPSYDLDEPPPRDVPDDLAPAPIWDE